MKKITKEDISNGFRKFKELFTPKAKRRLAITLSILLIGGAVYLNWLFFFAGNNEIPDGGADDIGAYDELSGNNLGDAEYVGADAGTDASSTSVASYFAVTTINRQRARDEAIEVLQSIVDNNQAADSERNEAVAIIAGIAASIESEANIEALVKSKGFEECVAVISDGGCTVVVKTTGLMPNEVAQIQEIVYEQAQILPADLKIVEKKA